ncbi:MAG: NAD(P)H-dependent oxidoreductase [Dehalococcoidales bacterium]|nr:NAD(P)H-dependent oxidoreductase [Dehalococcoidales bacterium]
MFKKTFLIVISLFLLGLTACSGSSTATKTTETDIPGVTSGGAQTTGNGSSGQGIRPVTSKTTSIVTSTQPVDKKVLVVYFSATNNTEEVAKVIAAKAGADLYEITPVEPYTAEDLRYYNNSRSDKENADPNCRPAIVEDLKDLEKYDVVFLGYPIWFGQAPKVIYTFLESYSLNGKTVVPFCTSSSSGIGNSDTNLHDLAKDATWIKGGRFSERPNTGTVEDWVSSLKY